MSRTHKDAQYSPLPIKGSGWYANWQAREEQLRKEQMSCKHLHSVVFNGPISGQYAVCTNCDKNLGPVVGR